MRVGFATLFLVLIISFFSPSLGIQRRDFGEITIEITNHYTKLWLDEYTGAYLYGSLWRPDPRNTSGNPRPLGHVFVGSYNKPQEATLLVLPSSSANVANPPLKPPVDWQYIYDDNYNSDSYDVQIFAPIPPPGYTALGLVAHPFKTGRPNLDSVYTVRNDLVRKGAIGPLKWNTRGAKGGAALSFYGIDTLKTKTVPEKVLLAPNSFFASKGYETPLPSAQTNVLLLPLAKDDESVEQDPPKLTSIAHPEPVTQPLLDLSFYIPFTAIVDNGLSLEQKVTNSPFYKLQRTSKYHLVTYRSNFGSTDETVEVQIDTGVTTSMVTTFEVNTGIKLTSEIGGSAGIFSAKVSLELSQEFGYQTDNGRVELKSSTTTTTVTVRPFSALALWTVKDTVGLTRGDGRKLTDSMSYNNNIVSWVVSHFTAPINSTN